MGEEHLGGRRRWQADGGVRRGQQKMGMELAG